MKKLKKLTLEELQEKHSQLEAQKRDLHNAYKEIQELKTLVNFQIKIIGKEIARIKDEIVENVVTDHAIVRYLERYQSLNIKKIEQKIHNLPLDEKVVIGSTTVTVGKILKNKKIT